jgi:hypothetical protein
LTINPQTGLPEAGFFDGLFETVAPIGLGILGAKFGLSPLTAGLLTGGAAYALSGDPMKGLTAGLGGAGGASFGAKLGSYGATKPVAEIAAPGFGAKANLAASSVPGTTGASAFTQGASNTLASGYAPLAGGAAPNLGFNTPLNTVSNVANVADDAIAAGAGQYSQNLVPDVTQGAKNFIGMGEAGKGPIDFFKSGPGEFTDAMTLGAPLLAATTTMPQQPRFPSIAGTQMNYEGPYAPQERNMRMPTLEEQQQMRALGSPEFSYFGNSNPSPGFQVAGYANGGTIQSGGLQDLYGAQDDKTTGPTLSRDGYGLGRLNAMASGGVAGYAMGGPVSFDVGGIVPYIGGPSADPAVANSYAVAPTNLAEVARLGQDPAPANDVRSMTQNAITDPFGRTTNQSSGMAGKGMGAGNRKQFGILSAVSELAETPLKPTMQDYISAAQRTYIPEQTMSTIGTLGAPELAQFTNINPGEVKKAAGGGIYALRSGGRPSKGGYLDGPGDGMSDSIPATIEGKQPARLADGEFVIPADVVSHLGNGSTKAGSKRLYAMLDKVRRARTGNKKQGKQINADKYLLA